MMIHKPGYHFCPEANWMNDPNGLIHWRGKYHLFYQHNPFAPVWGNIHWGHAVSEDLIHWQNLPLALSPGPGSPDADGCWSGVFVEHGGNPCLLYTGWAEGKQRPCLAFGNETLINWKKHPQNPIISTPPHGFNLTGFRDHAVWNEDGEWYQLIGAGQEQKGGLLFIYKSLDLIDWNYLHPFLRQEDIDEFGIEAGDIWECPDFFSLDGHDVLIFSAWKDNLLLYPVVLVGNYQDNKFMPISLSRVDFGCCTFYAPQTMKDSCGRRLMWGWIQERRSNDFLIEEGWAGVMSLPRELSLDSSGRLLMDFVPELVALRDNHWHYDNIHLTIDETLELPIEGNQLEFRAVLTPSNSGTTGFSLLRSESGEEEVLIGVNWQERLLFINLERSSSDIGVKRGIYQADLDLSVDEPVELHIFLDHSVIEVIANRRISMTARAYPDSAENNKVAVVNSSEGTKIVSLNIWNLHCIAAG